MFYINIYRPLLAKNFDGMAVLDGFDLAVMEHETEEAARLAASNNFTDYELLAAAVPVFGAANPAAASSFPQEVFA